VKSKPDAPGPDSLFDYFQAPGLHTQCGVRRAQKSDYSITDGLMCREARFARVDSGKK